MNIENLIDAEHEVLNHSDYKPNVIIGINKYISERHSGIANAIVGASQGETNLLIAPTGSGKSFSVISLLKESRIKTLFILPNSANVEQAMKEYNIPGAYGDLSAKDSLLSGDIVVMTWDKVSQLTDVDLSNHLIVIDEVHQTYTDTYRIKVIKGLYDISSRCKGRLDITATPNKLDFSIYDYITEYKQEIQTKYSVKMYENADTKTMIDILNNSENGALLMNDTKQLKYIASFLNKKSDIITSESKQYSKLYDRIMELGDMGDYKVLLNTTTIVAGVNIKNPSITDIIVVGMKDIGTIKQYVARFRGLEQCNIHIFNTYKEENNVYEAEWLITECIKKATMLRDTYNIICQGDAEFSTFGLNISPIDLDSNIYFNEDTNKYEVDEIYIRSQIYKRYYNSRTIESFKKLLEEYFDDIEVITDIKIDEEVRKDNLLFKHELKKAKEMALDYLSIRKNILVGYEDITNDKIKYNLMDYHSVNNINVEQCKKDYIKYNVHEFILSNSLKSTINLYSKYVLENSFSTELAWKLANMGNRKRGSIFAKMNTLIYKELKEEYPNAFKNDYSLEVRVYEWLINEFKPGMSYTSEHLDALAEAFVITFGENWALTPKKLGEILNQIYNIETYQTQKCNPVETLFYRNINPTALQNGKRIKINTIKSRIEIADIKAELEINDSDKSLEMAISRRKQKVLDKLDDTEKEILLEGLF